MCDVPGTRCVLRVAKRDTPLMLTVSTLALKGYRRREFEGRFPLRRSGERLGCALCCLPPSLEQSDARVTSGQLSQGFTFAGAASFFIFVHAARSLRGSRSRISPCLRTAIEGKSAFHLETRCAAERMSFPPALGTRVGRTREKEGR